MVVSAQETDRRRRGARRSRGAAPPRTSAPAGVPERALGSCRKIDAPPLSRDSSIARSPRNLSLSLSLSLSLFSLYLYAARLRVALAVLSPASSTCAFQANPQRSWLLVAARGQGALSWLASTRSPLEVVAGPIS